MHLPSFVTSVVGSLPRSTRLKQAFDAHQEHSLSAAALEKQFDEAVRDRVALQERAGIDVITDGEQRRASFVAFLGQKVPGFKLFRITDINPNSEEIMKKGRARLTDWRGIAVEKISAPRSLTQDELAFARKITRKQVKITLPSPYLIMWEGWDSNMSKRAYPEPEDLAEDYANLLRQEIVGLVKAGADFVQIDEPMVGDLVEATETEPDRYKAVAGQIHGQKYRGFKQELELAKNLVNKAVKGVSGVRIGLHLDRWPRKDSPFARIGYEKLCPQVLEMKVKQYVVEYSSPLAGDPARFANMLGADKEIGIGIASIRDRNVESPDHIVERVSPIVSRLGPERIWLNPDCGFAPGMYRSFPDDIIEAKLRSIVEAARLLKTSFA